MNQMGQKIVAMIALGTVALVIGFGELRQAQEATGERGTRFSKATR
jgi:hypothetical protein